MTIGRRVRRNGAVLRHVIQGVSEMPCTIFTGGGYREGRPVMRVRHLQSLVPPLYKLAVARTRTCVDLQCRLCVLVIPPLLLDMTLF